MPHLSSTVNAPGRAGDRSLPRCQSRHRRYSSREVDHRVAALEALGRGELDEGEWREDRIAADVRAIARGNHGARQVNLISCWERCVRAGFVDVLAPGFAGAVVPEVSVPGEVVLGVG